MELSGTIGTISGSIFASYSYDFVGIKLTLITSGLFCFISNLFIHSIFSNRSFSIPEYGSFFSKD